MIYRRRTTPKRKVSHPMSSAVPLAISIPTRGSEKSRSPVRSEASPSPISLRSQETINRGWVDGVAKVRRQGFCTFGRKVEAWRHLATYQLLLEKPRHHSERPGEGHCESVDRSVVSESEVPGDLTCRLDASQLSCACAAPTIPTCQRVSGLPPPEFTRWRFGLVSVSCSQRLSGKPRRGGST